MSLTVQVDKQNSKTAHYDNNHNHNHHSTNVQTILIFHFVFPLFIFSKTRQFMRCCCSNRSSCSVLFNSCIHLEPVSDSRFQIHSLSVVPSEQLPKIIMRRRKKKLCQIGIPNRTHCCRVSVKIYSLSLSVECCYISLHKQTQKRFQSLQDVFFLFLLFLWCFLMIILL